MRRILSVLLVALFLAGCGSVNDTPDRQRDNIYEFRNLENNERLGELILNEDNSVEITIDDSDITYIGYVEPLEAEQNYHISAAKPHTNFTDIVAGKDDEVYCIDCDILICDYDAQGNPCYFAGLFNNLETGKNPREPYLAKGGVIPIGNGYSSLDANRPDGQFARFITIVNEDESKSCKLAQIYTSDGFIFGGELDVDGQILKKDDNAIFYTEGRHIYGSYENELVFMVEPKNKDLDMELTLTCIDEENGIYKIKDYTHVEPSDVLELRTNRATEN